MTANSFDDLVNLFDSFCDQQSKSQNTVEYRLYYDDKGSVVTYTTEILPGTYIVIAAEDYVKANPNVIVKNGKIIQNSGRNVIHSKLEKNSSEGVRTSKYDINIIVDESDLDFNYWKLTTYDE